MTKLLPHWQLLSAPWRQRVTEKSYGGIIAMLGLLFALGGVMGFLKGGDSQSVTRSFSAVSAGFLQVLWMLQAMSFMQFNHPTHTRIVPGHLQRLRETVIATWLVASLACCLILGSAFGNTGSWFLASAAMMVFLVTAFVWPFLWVLGFFFPFFADFGLLAFVSDEVIPVYDAWPMACSAVLLLLCSRVLTHGLLRNGNSKHANAYMRARRVSLAMMPNSAGRQANLHHWGAWGTRTLNVILYPLHRYMRRLLSAPRPTPTHMMARAELVFGADVHWVMQASATAVLAGIVGVACLLARVYWGLAWSDKLSSASIGLAYCMLLIALMPVIGLQAALRRSQREQSLIMVLPGMPRGPELSRLLATRLIRQAAAFWLIAVCVASQLPYETGAARLMMSAYIGILPCFVFLIQDWAHLQEYQPVRVLSYGTIGAMGPVACFSAMYWLQVQPVTLLVASALITAALLRWRWSLLDGFPAALPAGRLSMHG